MKTPELDWYDKPQDRATICNIHSEILKEWYSEFLMDLKTEALENSHKGMGTNNMFDRARELALGSAYVQSASDADSLIAAAPIEDRCRYFRRVLFSNSQGPNGPIDYAYHHTVHNKTWYEFVTRMALELITDKIYNFMLEEH